MKWSQLTQSECLLHLINKIDLCNLIKVSSVALCCDRCIETGDIEYL